MIQSLLRAFEIDAWIPNYHHAVCDWPKVHAFGGVAVAVLREQFSDAESVVIDAMQAQGCDDTPLKKRHRWRAFFLLLY